MIVSTGWDDIEGARAAGSRLRHVWSLSVLTGLVIRSTHQLMPCEKWRRAFLRLVHPANRNAAMMVLRMIAMACGAVPARRVDLSSLKGGVAHPVESDLDGTPVVAQQLGEVLTCGVVGGEAGDAVRDLFGAALPVEAADVADDAEDLGGVWEVDRCVGGDRCGA